MTGEALTYGKWRGEAGGSGVNDGNPMPGDEPAENRRTTQPFPHADRSWDWALEKIAETQGRLDRVQRVVDCAEMWRSAIEGVEFESYSEELRELVAAVDQLLKETDHD